MVAVAAMETIVAMVCIACSLRHTMDAVAMQGEPSRYVGT